MVLSLEEVMYPKAQMVFLEPMMLPFDFDQAQGSSGPPGAITDAEVDMAPLASTRGFPVFQGIISPVNHGPVVVLNDQLSRLGIIGLDGVPDVLDYLAHD